MSDDILVGLGANLPTREYGEPRATLSKALAMFPGKGVEVAVRSRWYRSAPVPLSDQPWFVNAVVVVTCDIEPAQLLTLLLEIENELGRRRQRALEARPIDLDLIAYGDRVTAESQTSRGLVLPHPRMHERAFVLHPLREVVPDWRHPGSGVHIDELCAGLGPDQVAHPFESDPR